MTDRNNSEILIYQSENGVTKIDVTFKDETVWLSQQQMAELFQTSRTNVVEHIKHIYEEGELDEKSTCRKFRQVRKEGNRDVSRELPFYNLDMIISLGYRVKSKIATNFRRWATERLKEYMIKGFTMDDERLKNLGGGNYWKELLDRIRDIRSSEKVMYRQVLDLYATSVDYNPKSSESVAFFKMVQNKLHFAAHGHTAAEIIYERADSDKPFMGLTAFSGDFPVKKDIGIAKNYLDAKELKVLNNIVSGYFDFAEIQAMRHNPMYMSDYVEHLDNVLKATGENVLEGAGKISHAQAMAKANEEYQKYQVKNLSPVEEEYLLTIKDIEKQVKGHQ
ncbi:MAG: virulence RhuM family protein [Frisingicoccus sp.]